MAALWILWTTNRLALLSHKLATHAPTHIRTLSSLYLSSSLLTCRDSALADGLPSSFPVRVPKVQQTRVKQSLYAFLIQLTGQRESNRSWPCLFYFLTHRDTAVTKSKGTPIDIPKAAPRLSTFSSPNTTLRTGLPSSSGSRRKSSVSLQGGRASPPFASLKGMVR